MNRDGRTYIRVHDGMPDHPKIDCLSDAAFRLLITLWCWSSRHLTDGVIPVMTWTKRGSGKAREELLRAGLASITQPTGETIVMHDYLAHQRSRDEVAELRAKRAESGKRGGIAKATAVANAKANGVANAKQVLQQTATKTVAETETDTETDSKELPAPQNGAGGARPRDPLFDAIAAACGVVEPFTKSAGSQLAGVAKQLRDVAATPAQVAARAQTYRTQWPHLSLTPTALAKHWSSLTVALPLDRSRTDWEDN